MEDIKYKMLTVQIEEKLHRDIKVLASSKGLKMKELVEEVLKKEVARNR